LKELAPRAGLEPATIRLTVKRRYKPEADKSELINPIIPQSNLHSCDLSANVGDTG
jgi:hypothetical protein